VIEPGAAPEPPVSRPPPGSRRTTVRKRATKLEMEFRRRALVSLIQRGASFHEIRQYAMDTWELQLAGADRLARQALDSLVDSMAVYTGQSIAAVTLARAEFCFRKATQQNNLNAMIQANAQIAAHWVKAAQEVTITEGGGGDAEDAAARF
jgi:hypothetical protein